MISYIEKIKRELNLLSQYSTTPTLPQVITAIGIVLKDMDESFDRKLRHHTQAKIEQSNRDRGDVA